MIEDKKLLDCPILICEDSITILRIIQAFLEKAGARVFTALDGKIGLDICKTNKINLVISDINMPEMNGFELFAALKAARLDIPTILITDANIDQYIHLAIEHDIGNIMSKPIESKELILMCYKLITGNNIFGLSNYMDIVRLFKFNINQSQDIRQAIDQIISFGMENNLHPAKAGYLSIILDEVLSNAIYHAHGFTAQKLNKQAISLDPQDKVEVCFAANEQWLGIGVTDFKGILSKNVILKSFLAVVEEKKIIENAIKTGEDVTSLISESGRGLQMIRLMSNRYYFNIKRNKMTQVLILVNLTEDSSGKSSKSSSIKINEIY